MGAEHTGDSRQHRRQSFAGAWVLSVAAVALLAGCSTSPEAAPIAGSALIDGDTSTPAESPTGYQDLPNASLNALAADIEAFQNANQGSALSETPERVLDAPAQPNERETSEPSTVLITTNETDPAPIAETENKTAEAAGAQEIPAEPIISRETRIAQLSSELASLLKQESLEASDPARPLIAAAMLESVAAGVIEEIDLPGAGPLMLTEEERAALITIRELAVRLTGQTGEIGGDPQRIREVLTRAAEDLREHARVRIDSAELCIRAPGYGNYVPLPRRTFLAGRTNRMVVYTEVEHFGLRPAMSAEAMTAGDSVAAELTQELELYLHAGDSKPTWQRRIEWLPRTSRRAFRDLFLASAIELPATLSVGEYDLKVRVIDEVTGAEDETIIPIRLVADASALDGEPTGDTPGGMLGPPNLGSELPSNWSRSR